MRGEELNLYTHHRSSLDSRLLLPAHPAHTLPPSHTAVSGQCHSLAPRPPQSHSPYTCTDSSCEQSRSTPRPGPGGYHHYLCTLDTSQTYKYVSIGVKKKHSPKLIQPLTLTTAILSYTIRGVSAVQDGSTAAHTLLSDEGAGGLLVVLSVQTGAAGAGAHTRLILLTGGTPQCYGMTGT